MTLSKRISSTVKEHFFEFLYFFIFYYYTTITSFFYLIPFEGKSYKCVQVSIKKKKAFNKLKECVYDYCTDRNV